MKDLHRMQPHAADRSPSAAWSSPRWLAWVTALLAFLLLFRCGSSPDPASLDMSWMLVLAWAFDKRMQWGSDIIFTYGPLGFLNPLASYFPSTYEIYFVGQILLSLTAALLVFRFARRARPAINVVLIALLVAWYAMLTDDIGHYLMFVLAATVLYQELEEPANSRPLPVVTGVCAPAFVMLALGKFTLLLLWLAFLAYAVAMFSTHRRVRAAALTAMAWPCLLLIAWLACGQSPGGFVDHVRGSLELSSGYAAMMLTPPLKVDAVGVLVLLMLTLGLLQFARSAQGRPAGLLLASFLGLMMAMSWRAGFVRADSHVLIFFATASFIALAAWTARPSRAFVNAMPGGIVVVGLLVCMLAGIPQGIRALPTTLRPLIEPAAHREKMRAAWDAQSAQWDMPQVRRAIGNHTMDLLMNQQGIALINRLNYAPRPVFQGYAAYSPTLARINERYLLGTGAPDYLLANFGAIDNHYPTGDDPLSVLAAIRAYDPIGGEQDYLLFERRAADASGSPIGEPEKTDWHYAAIGADIPVGSGPAVLHHDVPLSLLGRLYALLLREPELAIEVTLADRSVVTHRLMRQNGLTGMLLSPYLGSQSDYLHWYAGLTDLDVVRLRVLVRHPWQSSLFSGRLRYVLAPVNLPRRPGAELASALRDVLYPGFAPTPSQVRGRSELRSEDGRQVLVVHPETAVEFKLSPGLWSGHGSFGLMTSTYNPSKCRADHGIEFIAEQVAANGNVQPLLLRAINRGQHTGLRGPRQFTYGPVTIANGDAISLRFAAGHDRITNAECMRPYLGEVVHEQGRSPPAHDAIKPVSHELVLPVHDSRPRLGGGPSGDPLTLLD